MHFKVELLKLSPEHARHVERFTGVPWNAEESAAMRGYAAFKRWHHQQLTERDQRIAAEKQRRKEQLRLVKTPGRTEHRSEREDKYAHEPELIIYREGKKTIARR